MASAPSRAARLPAARLAAFSTLMVSISGASFPLTAYLPAFYAQYHGIALRTVGLVFALVQIADTLWDPLVGHLSDHGRSRFGRRRIWIIVGVPIYIAATWATFMPAGHPGPLYLGACLILLYGSWTMLQIPYYAWSGELSGQYHERTRVQTYLGVAAAAGLTLVLTMPAILDQLGHAAQDAKVAAMGWFIIVTAMIGGVLTLGAFREAPSPPAGEPIGFASALRLLAGEPLLVRVLVSDFVVTIGQIARGTLMLFFFAQYMQLGAAVSLMFTLQYTFGIIASPIWLRVGYRLGKHRALVLGEVLQALINLSLMLVTPGAIKLLVVLTIAQGLTQSSGNLMLRAIVSDVADKQRLETGTDRAGLLFSVFGLSMKAATAVAVGLVLPLVSWLGFKASGSNDAAALFHLKCVFALVPFAAHSLSALVMLRFPLDEARYAEIRAALEAQGLEAEEPGTAESLPKEFVA
jgi:Na+/melibiose symporter-like transporter